MDSEAIEQRAAEWFVRQQSGRWAPSDQERLDAWLEADTAHRVAFVRLNAAWQYSARLAALGAGVAPGVIPSRGSWGFSPFLERDARRRAGVADARAAGRGALLRRYAGFAAAAVLLVAGAGVWYASHSPPGVYRTQVGKVGTIPLADGSSVTLNTDSRIHVAMSETERVVELDQGEAFFVVARDARRPFAVVAGDKRIVATGTRFSVRRDGADVRVAVTEGSVRLERGDGGDAVPVTPLDAGDVANTAEAGVLVQQRPLPEVEQILSWRTGYLTFRDTGLADAVAEFNRYSARKIVIDDPRIDEIRIGGNFRTDNVEAFLWLVRSGFPIEVEEQGDRIVLRRR